jgi:hypothetical protein
MATDKAIPHSNQEIFMRTITLDNTVAEAFITSPEKKQIVRDTVEIIGTANDDNFSDYQVFWGKGDKPSTWKEITNLKTAPIVNNVLASWDTTGLDGVYTIRLLAHDKSQHEASYSVMTIVDNTAPTAEILSPREKDQVGGVVTLTGTATDANFKDYIIEYGEGAEPKVWVEASEDARRSTSVTQGKLFDWLSGDKLGKFTLRLTVTDEVDHQSQDFVTVEVVPAIKNQEGGERVSSDSLATIYLSPNSLKSRSEAVITVNRVALEEIPPVPEHAIYTSLGVAYKFGPEELILDDRKPATLTMNVSNLVDQPFLNTRPLIFRWDGQWKKIGGRFNEKTGIINTAVNKLGLYALMEVTKTSEGFGDAKIIQLTCQPRVFSPRGNVYKLSVTISFYLEKSDDVTIKIYNAARRLERILIENQKMYEGNNAVEWDGKDDDGNIVTSGLYVVTISTSKMTAVKTVVVLNK